MSDGQVSKAIRGFIAKALIIVIGLYMTASAIGPFFYLNNQTFKIIFTLSAGFPTLYFFLQKERRECALTFNKIRHSNE